MAIFVSCTFAKKKKAIWVHEAIFEVVGSNLSPGTSCWKVGSYLPIPGGLQRRILTN